MDSEEVLSLKALLPRLAVCRLDSQSTLPAWATAGKFWAAIHTFEELSVVCEENLVPRNVQAQGGWRALQVYGPLEFSLVGVLAGLSTCLAEAGVSIFALSTYDTDYLLIQERSLDQAIKALREHGYRLKEVITDE